MKNQSLIKIFVMLFLMIGIISGSVSFSAEVKCAPLIENGTTSIMKVDLSKINYVSLLSQISDIADLFIKDLIPAKQDQDSAKSMLRLTLPMITMPYANLLETFQEAGVKELYIVKNNKDVEKCPFYLAVPAEGLSKEEVSKIRGLGDYLNENFKNEVQFRYPFKRHNFVFLPAVTEKMGTDKEIQTYYKGRFKDLDTVENKNISEALSNSDNSSFFAVLSKVSAENAPLLKSLVEKNGSSASLNKAMEETFLKMQKDISEKLRYTYYDVNLEKLGIKVVSVVETPSDLDSLKGTIPQIADTIAEQVKKQGGTPEAAESVKSLANLFKPTIDQNKMVWDIDLAFIKANRESLVKVIKLYQTINEKKTEKIEKTEIKK